MAITFPFVGCCKEQSFFFLNECLRLGTTPAPTKEVSSVKLIWTSYIIYCGSDKLIAFFLRGNLITMENSTMGTRKVSHRGVF